MSPAAVHDFATRTQDETSGWVVLSQPELAALRATFQNEHYTRTFIREKVASTMNQAWKYTVVVLIILAAISFAITNVVALHAFVAVLWAAGATMLLLALGLAVGRLVLGHLKRAKNPE